MDERTALECRKLGQRIKAARTQLKMSQADLAEASNLSLSHIGDIERGCTLMRLPSFIRICEALGVSADSLIRPDVPVVNNIYQGEFAKVLEDCSPEEIDAILKVVKEIKTTLQLKKETY